MAIKFDNSFNSFVPPERGRKLNDQKVDAEAILITRKLLSHSNISRLVNEKMAGKKKKKKGKEIKIKRAESYIDNTAINVTTNENSR